MSTRLIGILDATYPSGQHGNVTLFWRMDGHLTAPPEDLEDFASALRGYYHRQIGPAYTLDDFTYTFWVASDEEGEKEGSAFFWLVGPYMTNWPDSPDTVHP